MIYRIKRIISPLLKGILLGTVLSVVVACNDSNEVIFTKPVVNAENIKAHLEFLADDTLLGRDTGSEGYQIAANYVKSQFKQLGLTPMGKYGTYEQKVTFRKSFLEQGAVSASITNASGKTILEFPEQFISGASSLNLSENITAPTVFVGYGIVSEAFGLDDYAGLDVEGKVVVALTGRPESLPTEEGAHIGSSKEKIRHAVERGAIGFITVHTPKREAIRPFEKSINTIYSAKYSWLDNNGKPFGSFEQLQGGMYISDKAAALLFEGAMLEGKERKLADIFADDTNNQVIKGFPLNATVSLASKSRHEEITSPNIVAVLEGSDPILKNEYVVYSAHLDHVGVSTHSEDEDKINNGALDNASGVAILLETARLLSTLPEKPKRSILFVVVTAEERGLLGSSYFANNPTVPATSMIANVNLDMPLVLYPFSDIVAFGATHSSLGDVVSFAAGKVDIVLSPDPIPEQAIFTRSDHYSFVKVGIPSVFLMTGFTSKDPDVDGGKVFREFLSTHYHNHSDEIELPINYDAAARFAEVNMMIGVEIANGENRPTWNEGDFFGNTFAQ